MMRLNEEPEEIINKDKEVIKDENEITQIEEEEEIYKLTSNLYFPNNIGLTFCVNHNIQELELNLSFGTYKESSANMIGIKYNGEGIELISQFSLQELIDYDVTNKILFLKKKLEGKKKRNQKSGDYLILDSCLKNFASEISRDHKLLKHIKKLVYGKDKWQRIPHNYNFKIGMRKATNIL